MPFSTAPTMDRGFESQSRFEYMSAFVLFLCYPMWVEGSRRTNIPQRQSYQISVKKNCKPWKTRGFNFTSPQCRVCEHYDIVYVILANRLIGVLYSEMLLRKSTMFLSCCKWSEVVNTVLMIYNLRTHTRMSYPHLA
jgi:hypothetical protein